MSCCERERDCFLLKSTLYVSQMHVIGNSQLWPAVSVRWRLLFEIDATVVAEVLFVQSAE